MTGPAEERIVNMKCPIIKVPLIFEYSKFSLEMIVWAAYRRVSRRGRWLRGGASGGSRRRAPPAAVGRRGAGAGPAAPGPGRPRPPSSGAWTGRTRAAASRRRTWLLESSPFLPRPSYTRLTPIHRTVCFLRKLFFRHFRKTSCWIGRKTFSRQN